jgi:hypothetical protein
MVDGMKAEFQRYLQEGFLPALKRAYAQGGWWRSIADDHDVFVAVRGGYINAYFKGNSLARLDFRGDKLIGGVHYKYLLNADFRPEYVAVVDDKPLFDRALSDFFLADLSNIAAMKKAAEPYGGIEKTGVHSILRCNPNILDVEIAFGGAGSENGASAARMGFAALQEDVDAMRLVFFEAKDFSNRDLRTSGEKASVVEQICGYRDLLEDEADAVEAAYRRVCSLLLAMDGAGIRNRARDDLMHKVVGGKKPLVVDTKPRLVIFGFDDAQSRGTAWVQQLNKLRRHLPGPILLKGDPKGFTAGISTPARMANRMDA